MRIGRRGAVLGLRGDAMSRELKVMRSSEKNFCAPVIWVRRSSR